LGALLHNVSGTGGVVLAAVIIDLLSHAKSEKLYGNPADTNLN